MLGNTTIFAENPSDSEVNNYLQSLAHGAPQPPNQVSQGSWRPPQPPSKQGTPFYHLIWRYYKLLQTNYIFINKFCSVIINFL